MLSNCDDGLPRASVAVRTCFPSVLVLLSASLLLSCAPPALPAPPSTTTHTCSASVLKPTRPSSTHHRTHGISSSFGLFRIVSLAPVGVAVRNFLALQPVLSEASSPSERPGPACQTICFLPNPSLPAVHLVTLAGLRPRPPPPPLPSN